MSSDPSQPLLLAEQRHSLNSSRALAERLERNAALLLAEGIIVGVDEQYDVESEKVADEEYERLLTEQEEREKAEREAAEELGDDEEVFVVYKRRWYMLLSYVFVSIVNNVMFITFGPLGTLAGQYFGEGAVAVNAQSAVFSAMGILLMVPGLWVLKQYGLQVTLRGVAISNGAAGVIRLIAPFVGSRRVYFWLIFISQFAASVGNPAINAVPPDISVTWFGVSERAVATTIGALGTLVGLGGGFAASTFIVDKPERFATLFVLQGALAVGSAIPLFFFQKAPPSPPSTVAQRVAETTLSREIKDMLKDRSFLCLMATLGLGYGQFVSIWTTMSQIVAINAKEDLGTVSAGVIGLSMVGAGLIGSGIAGAILDNLRSRVRGIYRIVMTVGTCGGILSLLAFYLAVMYAPFWAMVLTGSLMGFFDIALLPVIMEIAAEITFPADEATSSGLLILVGNIVATAAIALMSVLPVKWTMLGLVAFSAVVVVALILFDPVYKRLEFENAQKALLVKDDDEEEAEYAEYEEKGPPAHVQ